MLNDRRFWARVGRSISVLSVSPEVWQHVTNGNGFP